MPNPRDVAKHLARRAVETLGYTIVRTERVQQAWNLDMKTIDMQRDADFAALYAQTRAYTMTSMARMYALYKATEYLAKRGIPGDIVECGVWRGGSSMLLALALQHFGTTDRTLYLYDTFEGMSEPTSHDVNVFGEPAARLLSVSRRDESIWAYASLDEVRANLRATGYPDDRLRFVQGKVEDTLPGQAPERIALLRLDTDWYASTYHELRELFPRLVQAGVLVLDDYGHWAGARAAVDQYFAEQDIWLLLDRVDYTGRIALNVTAPA